MLTPKALELLQASEKRPTVELTRRRESKHPSPHQVSYETRSRRSRPTICFGLRRRYKLFSTFPSNDRTSMSRLKRSSTPIEKEVRFLKIYAAIATLVGAVFFLSAFVLQTKKQKFDAS